MNMKKICPICEVKKLSRKLGFFEASSGEYNNGAALTPPMGWSSWNLFATKINEDLIKEIAVAMDKSGLKDVGYVYVNIDDCWQGTDRDSEGRLTCDRQSFPGGIRSLSDFVNERGLKLGLYSSNGTHTCEDYPASLGHEAIDADTFAEWGVEYFKYDYCHHVTINTEAPKIAFAEISGHDGEVIKTVKPSEMKLFGSAKIEEDKDKLNPSGALICGIGGNEGFVLFSVNAEKEGKFVLTLTVKKHKGKEQFLIVECNGNESELYTVSSQSGMGYRRYQLTVSLKEGENCFRLFNPIASRFDSAAYQYNLMGRELKRATREYAERNSTAEKPIVYSICEWGLNKPYKWGREAGNLWRTTPDIKPFWASIMLIYEHNVKLFRYSSKGAWNDPDMLEVGNGKLTYDENRAHFSLWCMMNAPLILGNDIREYILPDGSVNKEDKSLRILSNRTLISINQDELGVQARRIKTGIIDILAKPLSSGKTALCIFNKGIKETEVNYELSALANESFISVEKKASYEIIDAWTGVKTASSRLCLTVKPHSAEVFIIG